MEKRKWYVKIWSEGKCFGFYSVSHLIFGMILAGILLLFLDKDLISGLIIALALMIAWEFWELFRNMEENLCNRVFDVIIGLIGFFVMHKIITINFHPTKVLITILIIYILLNIWNCLTSEETPCI